MRTNRTDISRWYQFVIPAFVALALVFLIAGGIQAAAPASAPSAAPGKTAQQQPQKGQVNAVPAYANAAAYAAARAGQPAKEQPKAPANDPNSKVAAPAAKQPASNGSTSLSSGQSFATIGKNAGKLSPLAWSDMAPIPIGRDRHGVASTGTALYAIGGETWNGTTYVNTGDVQRYDPGTNSYTALAAMPAALSNIEACAMNGKIYVPGGYAGSGPPFSNTFYIYDIATNAWTTGPAVPGAGRLWYSAVCNATSNKLYVIGGYDGTAGTASNDIYDVATTTWSSGAPMPDQHYGSEGVLIGGNIYIGLGSVAGLSSTELLGYNIASNTWTTLAAAPAGQDGIFGASGVGPDNKFYIAGGGFGTGGTFLSRAMRYDPVANTWAMIDSLNVPMQHVNGGFAGGFMYTIGGATTTSSNARCPGTGSAGICDHTQKFIEGAATNTPTNTNTPTSTPTSTNTPSCTPAGYVISTATGTVIPGTTDIGNHADDSGTTISLPFPVTLYGTAYTSAVAGSNGHLTFGTAYNSFSVTCSPTLPAATYAIGPYWVDQRTDCTDCGIFTTVSGVSPNQVLNIEYRTIYYGQSTAGTHTLDYEVQLYQNSSTTFDVVYGMVTPYASTDSAFTIDVQKDNLAGDYTIFSCQPDAGTPPVATGQKLNFTYTNGTCATPTFTPTPAPCGPGGPYDLTTSTGAVLDPGTTLVPGSQIDDGTVAVAMPFPVKLYNVPYTTANVSSNGNIQFSSNYAFYPSCLPNANVNNAVLPLWADLDMRTTIGYPGTPGIYTSTTGVAPNRVFNIEWRACTYNSGACGSGNADFEVRFYENQDHFEMVYGTVVGNANGSTGTVGVQKGTGTSTFTQFSCNTASLSSGLKITGLPHDCAVPSNTPTNTFTPTNTPTFTSTPTYTSTPFCTPAGYSYVATSGATIVPGTTDIGNHCDDCNTTVTLPFPYQLYGTTYNSVNVGSNGKLEFGSNNEPGGYTNSCLPGVGYLDTIFPHWDDLYTVATGYGIFSSVSGVAPNRIFNLEWRDQFFPGTGTVNFEVRLYEGQQKFDIIYGQVDSLGTGATVGVQHDAQPGDYTQYECNTGGLTNGLMLTFTYSAGTCPTATPTNTPSPTSTPICPWTQQAPYPINVLDNAVASQGGKIYSFAGVSNDAVIATAYVYDPVANTWTSIAPLPAAREQASAVSDGTYIYILGGADNVGNNTGTIYRYDPATNTYNTSLANFTVTTWAQAAAYLNGKIYKIGGCTANCAGSVSTVEAYDIASGTWTTVAPLPQPIGWLSAVGMGGYVYAAGGTVPASIATTYRYDPVANTWNDAAIADLPISRWGAASDTYNGKWLLAGGYVNDVISNSAVIWDPVANTWTEYGPMPAARGRMGGASAGMFDAIGGRGPTDVDAFAGHTDNQQINCPSGSTLVGHVTYQGIAQPSVRNQQPITLTLCVSGSGQNYVTSTDNTGHFTVTLSLTGSYPSKVKDYKNLSNGQPITLTSGINNVEFGTLKAGDANNNDLVNTADFTLLKAAFGTSNNSRTDFNNDGITNTTDFTLQKGNFGLSGTGYTCP